MDKMASLGILVSGVAHEINNPNQFVMANLTMLSEAWRSAKPLLEQYYRDNGDFLLGDLSYLELREHIPEMFNEVLRGSQRIKYIVHELRDFARQRPAELTDTVDLSAVVHSTASLLANMLKKSTNHFRVNCCDDLPEIQGSFRRLEQVVINLVQNACQSLSGPDKGITISTYYDEPNDTVVLKVRDEGMGMTRDALHRISDPFYTTRRGAGGTGLGVAIALRIVSEHGGALDYQSVPGEGSTATISLPVEASYVGKSGGDLLQARSEVSG